MSLAAASTQELAEKLLEEYDQINERFHLADYRPSELSGGRFSEAMRRSGLYGDAEAGMVGTGETAGSVEEMLGKVADHGAAEVEAALRRLPVVTRVVTFALGALITGVAFCAAVYTYFTSLFRAFE